LQLQFALPESGFSRYSPPVWAGGQEGQKTLEHFYRFSLVLQSQGFGESKPDRNLPENAMKTTFNLISNKLSLTLFLTFGAVSAAFAQGQIASGTVSSTGSGPYVYDLTFSDGVAATSPIGSVWYAWVPGFFYLPGVPTSASAPAGWTATVSANSVQYTANAPADYIQPGQSLSGFSYNATFTPAQLAAAPNSGVSVAYSAGLFSDAGDTFTVQAVPEPSSMSFLGAGLIALTFAGRRQPRKQTIAV
jgi:hypothetical protein